MTPDTDASTLVVRIGPTTRPPGAIAAAIDASDAVSGEALPGSLPDGPAVRTVEDESDIDRLLSEEVQAVLDTVATDPPDSVAALADRFDRPREAVEDDLEFLVDLRILSLRTGGEAGDVAERPVLPYESLEYEAVLESSQSGA